MMKILLKILKWVGISLLILIIGVLIYVLTSWNKTYDQAYPDIKASTDSTLLARGEYLVYGPAHCAECHTDIEGYKLAIKGEKTELYGGYEFKLPFGSVYSRNLTSDKETGIGNYTDGELGRAVRYSIKKDGHLMIPFMNYQNMSDEDLTAVISYLRTLAPVKKEIPEPKWNLMGKAVLTFFLKPVGPNGVPPKSVSADTTIAYGKYLATAISNCNGCHTPVDFRTGKVIGPEFSGGNKMESATMETGVFMMTPNLTPDPETGIIYNWTQADFIKRFRDGKLYPESIMPWGPFKNFSDNDLKAIYAYLKSLPPTKHEIVSGVIRE